jgi:hypothetical protein
VAFHATSPRHPRDERRRRDECATTLHDRFLADDEKLVVMRRPNNREVLDVSQNPEH